MKWNCRNDSLVCCTHIEFMCRKDSTMLITIQQTKSNFENLFEIISGGQLLFQAKAPWMKLSLPFHADHLRELTFTSPAGETVYTTRYKFIDNLVEESIPYKYLLTKEQRFGQFEIVGQNGSEGSFYVMQNGYFDSKFCIEHMGKVYLGYSIDKGRNNYVSIYDGDRQIAQITKPLAVIDNLDVYFLHIKDEYASIVPVLSFFTVYYDYRKYNHSGELTKNSVQIATSYSYGKNNDKYNPNWISGEFGQQAADELDQTLKKIAEQSSAQAKKIVKLVGLIFLFLILFLILFTIVLFVILKYTL